MSSTTTIRRRSRATESAAPAEARATGRSLVHQPSTRARGAAVARRALLRAGALLLALTGACVSVDNAVKSELAAGKRCALDSDCTAPNVCVFDRCHAECATSADCPSGERCVEGELPGSGVCQLAQEKLCGGGADCPGAQVCGVDGECRDLCGGDADCLPGQVCTQATCADPDELDETGALPEDDEHVGEGQPCVYHSDCPDELLCVQELCGPECKGDKDCPEGLSCIEQRCGVAEGECVDDGDCASGTICRMQACVPGCASDPDCPDAHVCVDGACTPGCNDPSDCAAGDLCVGGECVAPCATPTDCPVPGTKCASGLCLPGCDDPKDCDAGLVCGPTGLCELAPCVVPTDCPVPGTKCEGGACVPGCDDLKDCEPGYVCGPAGVCELAPCVVPTDCPMTGTKCEGGACVPGCDEPTDCDPGYQCGPAGVCELEPCSADSQCGASELCLAGVCTPPLVEGADLAGLGVDGGYVYFLANASTAPELTRCDALLGCSVGSVSLGLIPPPPIDATVEALAYPEVAVHGGLVVFSDGQRLTQGQKVYQRLFVCPSTGCVDPLNPPYVEVLGDNVIKAFAVDDAQDQDTLFATRFAPANEAVFRCALGTPDAKNIVPCLAQDPLPVGEFVGSPLALDRGGATSGDEVVYSHEKSGHLLSFDLATCQTGPCPPNVGVTVFELWRLAFDETSGRLFGSIFGGGVIEIASQGATTLHPSLAKYVAADEGRVYFFGPLPMGAGIWGFTPP